MRRGGVESRKEEKRDVHRGEMERCREGWRKVGVTGIQRDRESEVKKMK